MPIRQTTQKQRYKFVRVLILIHKMEKIRFMEKVLRF